MRAAATERHMLDGVVATNVELVRFLEGRFIPVRRQVVDDHPIALVQRLTGQLRRRHDRSAKMQNRCGPTQHLLDRTWNQSWVGRQRRTLVGMFGQREDGMAEGVAGGLVARYRQQQEELVQLVRVETDAVDLCGQQG